MDRLRHGQVDVAVRVLHAAERSHDPPRETGFFAHLAQRGLLERLAAGELALGQAQRARSGQAIPLLADHDLGPVAPASEEHAPSGCLGDLLHAEDGIAAEEQRPRRTVPPAPRGGNVPAR